MRIRPTALGFVDDEWSGVGAQWDRAQVARLARRLGYALIWPDENSMLALVDQVRESDVDAVLIPSSVHLDALTLDRLMHTCDVETVLPRETFARYFGGRQGCPA
ncbi:hypothetical protein [Nocardia seriolae]|uniref:Uncharacterized protein n=1 Tax=Nocardia seriolae TaxID=37332 RepID=A0A0B8NB41_9NOCA|nr:hypothetical protein [Nocardia seriolae]APA97531.1 hypothetical protein NS506_03479 [Nocardia seriolae]MTJ62425.1 hypothetical protein [Nocardia seriolae]MTJ74531.1 hypothetical protein [Nocardia seriolae]MTJ87328.1 hypothetical protein [Nocardia seriolae]MTK31322.1 hypothetical protein [Nocardia seriolae]